MRADPKYYIRILLAASLAFGLFSVPAEAAKKRTFRYDPKTRWTNLKAALVREARKFKGQACFVIKDLKTGWEIDYGGNVPVPAASVIKIPIMSACLEEARKGGLNLNSVIVLRECHKVSGSGKLKCMPSGTKYSIRKLIELMITESDNTAANMLIRGMGFGYLNSYFKRIGLKNTSIYRYMMDLGSRQRGVENYTDARDMALILEKIYRGTLGGRQVSQECMYFLKRQTMRDRIPKKLPANTVVAHKTGLENGICHDVGIVFTRKGDFIISVLTKHRNKRAYLSKKFIAQISWLTYNYFLYK